MTDWPAKAGWHDFFINKMLQSVWISRAAAPYGLHSARSDMVEAKWRL